MQRKQQCPAESSPFVINQHSQNRQHHQDAEQVKNKVGDMEQLRVQILAAFLRHYRETSEWSYTCPDTISKGNIQTLIWLFPELQNTGRCRRIQMGILFDIDPIVPYKAVIAHLQKDSDGQNNQKQRREIATVHILVRITPVQYT